MKISICIPQYNRIRFLLLSLDLISRQDYEDIEVVISDDCSSDNTAEEIGRLKPSYRYPIVFHRNDRNLGYDRNLRKSLEMASGEYCIVLGNDDSLHLPNSISFLVRFLKENDLPDLGFCNFVEFRDRNVVVGRAKETKVIGSGADVALKHYSCFSFVGGLIFKRSAFGRFNTSKHDGSVYVQMYLGVLMTASGCRLFSIKEPLVLKDLHVDGKFRHSYRDRLARTWKDFRVTDAGLDAVMRVLISAFQDAGCDVNKYAFSIMKRVLSVTLPFWILDYKSNKAFVSSVGIFLGLNPGRNQNVRALRIHQKLDLYLRYYLCGGMAFVTPVRLFNAIKWPLYRLMKS